MRWSDSQLKNRVLSTCRVVPTENVIRALNTRIWGLLVYRPSAAAEILAKGGGSRLGRVMLDRYLEKAMVIGQPHSKNGSEDKRVRSLTRQKIHKEGSVPPRKPLILKDGRLVLRRNRRDTSSSPEHEQSIERNDDRTDFTAV